MVQYIGVDTMRRLVAEIGVAPLLVGLTDAIENDSGGGRRSRRWRGQPAIPTTA